MSKKLNFTELSLAEQDKSKTVSFIVKKNDGIVVCKLYDRWYDRWFYGKTICKDGDKFNEKKGRAIAFNKARRKELEFTIKRFDDQRTLLDRLYNEEVNRLDKQQGLLYNYLEGVNLALEELVQ